MSKRLTTATAFINTKALHHNLKLIKSKAPNSKVLAIVKANAYGHGVIELAKQITTIVDGFGVARVEEAQELRAKGITKPILLLEGFYSEVDLDVVQSCHLQTAVHCVEQVEAIENLKLNNSAQVKPITVWLKLDTGMHRLGFRPEEYKAMVNRLMASPNVEKPLRFISHFGRADETENPTTNDQLQLFLSLIANAPLNASDTILDNAEPSRTKPIRTKPSDTNLNETDAYPLSIENTNISGTINLTATKNSIDFKSQNHQTEYTNQRCQRSIAASSGILAWPNSHLDWIRPGIIMYGISPFATNTAEDLGFQPVMSLKTSLIAVRTVKANESIGYGGAWTATKETKIGVIAIGYGDGYPRLAPNNTPVLINNRIVPLVGRVSMDMLTIDLGLGCQEKVGDEVTLWGDGLPVEEVANHVGTIAYELVTQLTQRVKISYLDNSFSKNEAS